ncbi:ATP-dependent Clp protease ATP-binding subunit CLPT2, chloroplastic-like [Andrographis paniculata]|uniref:ATP-dependent Clp protease ATP-binding subunit CLPT2, chloroplastic-like n=1 Tax=Andrographis paniculata TaxID=175694 RepID=UPI0021E97C2F|nr:ATP-dependent Clp protease ATP-binding subunit CLPT2, chloroplastic-like [Andrographis paniculata]
MAARALSATSVITLKHNQLDSSRSTGKPLAVHGGLRSQWLGSIPTAVLSLHSSNLRNFHKERPRVNATISFSLPAANPDKVGGTDKIPKWSSKAIKSFAMAELEARKLKSPTTGTEALLMGILIEGTSFASKLLRASGITLLKVRDEISKLRGKPDMYYFSPEHPPLTEEVQKAIDWAIDEKIKSGDGEEITTTHLLLGLWHQEDSPGHKILAAFGFDEDQAKVLHSLISKPGFVEI